ncbi:MFS transporter [Curtobacterium sp. MCPF17_047]|uniref:MFS transporter n=1 Tax=Curtobacterium sp. MCPF17_047 TaxID=2175654 RepID=UPI000DA73CFD|nr:MFS transporter [Curtobacterium sp. MCPF17_047]PZF64943.1 MFS transporter [Curtobacterium sp. MCPF17_047]
MTTTTARRTSSTAVAVLVAGTFFMELLDGTILATAAPAMGRDLGVDSAAVGVAITAYLVTLAVFIPVSGWITDRVGSRTVFVGAIALFTVASALCAASTGLVELTLWRILQGLGGALMVPVGRLVVLRSAGRDQLVTAIAILTWPALAAPVIAPFLGGVLVDTLSWHWIFLVNIPLGVVAVVAALLIVPQERAPERVPFDWLGSLLACLGLGALVVMASLLALDTVPVVPTVLAGVVGALCTWLAIRHFLRAAHPIMGLGAFRLETFRVSHAGGSLFRLAVSAVPFVLPLLFQDAWGWTALEAGSAVLWVFVGNLGIKPATTPFLRWWGYRPVIVVSSAVAALSVVAMVFLTPTTPFWLLVVLLVVSGAARSVGFTAYNTIAFADVEQPDMTAANTLSSTLQQTAAGFGVAVVAVVLRAAAGVGGEGLAGSGPYAVAFVVIAVLLVVACVEGLLMSRTAGETVRPSRRLRTGSSGVPRS